MIEPWKADHEQATIAHALDTLFPLIIEGCELARDSFPQVKRNMFEAHSRHESVLVLGSKYYDHYKNYLEYCEPLLTIARELVGEGHKISTLAGAEAAVGQLRHFFETDLEHFPRIRPDEIAISTEQYERGEYRDAREALEEIRRRSDR